jgi:riboflavin synthase
VFTGIITAMARVVRLQRENGGLELAVAKPQGFVGTNDGDSIAINGVCLTVKESVRELAFDVIPETVARTNLGALEVGEEVNIEPSLRFGDFVGGHMVYGHVDATTQILRRDPEGQGVRLWCATPPALGSLIVEKGYVSLDGASLTVAAVEADRFAVALIPETLKRTTLGRKGVGLSVNLEADPIARYVAAQLRDRADAAQRGETPRGR